MLDRSIPPVEVPQGPQNPPLTGSSKSPLTLRTVRHVVDRLATGIVTGGGLATIMSILGIFLFLFLEVVPLLYPATTRELAMFNISLLNSKEDQGHSLVAGIDEYMEIGYLIDGRNVSFYSVQSGTSVPIPTLDLLSEFDVTTVAQSNSSSHQFVLGTRDGKAVPLSIQFDVEYNQAERSVLPRVTIHSPQQVLPEGHSVVRMAFQNTEEEMVYVALSSTGEVWLTVITEAAGLFSEEGEVRVIQQELIQKTMPQPSVLLLDSTGEWLVTGSADGYLYYWNLADPEEPRFIGSYSLKLRNDAITALTYLIGDRSLVVGTQKGRVSVWMPYRDPNVGGDPSLRFIREFSPHSSAVRVISPSQRNKGFLTGDAEGNMAIHHSTSHQTVATMDGAGSPLLSLQFAPKGNGAVAYDLAGRFRIFSIENEHPESTIQSLFFPVLYEGYSEPKHIWQSSSGSDEFEPKLGLWPLIFGTLKGTFYAMLFATPLAMFGAIYTAMFMNPNVRAIVKPLIELMAALPTVVLGFLAGLWFAPLLEKIFPSMLAMFVVLPIVLTVTAMMWQVFPVSVQRYAGGWLELISMMFVIVGVVYSCWTMNHFIEVAWFDGDYKNWLHSVFGVGYDQRNALVIAFAMGLAVIPTIFSISEDALSNVPKHLIAGSLAMGATRWQTLARLVLISASPGLFSALMIGLGRVVGETMIVLMATGNTPLTDMNLFNGFRTLSANIAVEMPEAPHGGTLYRLLFLSALILFAFTTVVNTIAEVVRQKLQTRYSQY